MKNRGRRVADLITDHDVWLQRERTWVQWALRYGFHVESVKRDMAMRGWRRDTQGRLSHCPCAKCGRPTSVASLGLLSQCESCRVQVDVFDEDVQRFREELRSEEHTSELQSRDNHVCRLLL